MRPVPLAGLAVCVALLSPGCAKRETAVESGLRTQTLHVSNGSDPSDLDPQIIGGMADINIARALLEGLTEVDPKDGQAIPGVAERWESSADGLTWTFHLRATARWSNGDPVTAHDFVYSFQRFLSPGLGSGSAEFLFCLKHAEKFLSGEIKDFSQVGVHARDPLTLELTLEHPVPYLPTLASNFSWLPVHRPTIEKFGRMDQRATAWTRPGNYVGNGAFVLRAWTPNQVIRVTKSATYWDRDRVKLNEVAFYPMEAAAEEMAFRSGQLHATTRTLPFQKITAYRSNASQASWVHESSIFEVRYLQFNCTRAPFADVRVRRALALAIDRVQLARNVIHCERAAPSFTPPGCGDYRVDATLPFNVEEARQLLTAAGFPGGRGFPRIELLCSQVLPVIEAIQQMWRTHLGIDVALHQQEHKVKIDTVAGKRYDVTFAAWTGDFLDPTAVIDQFRSQSPQNESGWANADYDRLLQQSDLTVDQALRYGIMQRAETLMLAAAPVVPLYHQPKIVLLHPALKGWHGNPLDLHTLKFVSLEK